MRRAAVLAVVAAAFAVASASAGAAPGARFGVTDDAWLLYGQGSLDSRVAELDRRGVDIVRVSVHWDATARREPRDARDPEDRAYRWGQAGRALDALHRHGIDPLVTLVGTPLWATDGDDTNAPPRSADLFADFAYAAAERFPYVRYWTIWNEPNQRLWLDPPSPSLYVNRLLNPGYAAIKQANPRALVGGGVTAPRGNTGGVSPLAWIKAMGKAGARLDAYAHHPYPLLPRAETPWTGGCRYCETVTMATLERLINAVNRYLGPKRIWLTEYGYQTSPPDHWLGVTWAQQAHYVAEAALRVWKAPHVDMLINFMYRDDADDDPGFQAGWQSGFYSAAGRVKPSLLAFTLPLVQVSRAGSGTSVWGQVRPRSGPQSYRLQVFRGGSWQWVGPTLRTGARGNFLRKVSTTAGERLRFWSTADHEFSLTLTIKARPLAVLRRFAS
jgi:hypothetical protein